MQGRERRVKGHLEHGGGINLDVQHELQKLGSEHACRPFTDGGRCESEPPWLRVGPYLLNGFVAELRKFYSFRQPIVQTGIRRELVFESGKPPGY
jgi:hypothetical protein